MAGLQQSSVTYHRGSSALTTKYHSPVVAADVHDHVLRLLVRVDGVQEEEGARHVLDVVLREESGGTK